jgi:hypothetical protein
MRMPYLSFVLAATFLGCVRGPSPSPTPVGDDRTIIFPQFFEYDAIAVGAQGRTYELDGEVLKALTIAANDFLPAGDQRMPCHRKREAQFYRVIRQQNVIFVYIHDNPAYCGRSYPALDSGVQYAISTDGRILRRLFDGQEGGPFDIATPKESAGGVIAEPGTSPMFEALGNNPAGSGHSDGGADGGVDGGVPSGPSPAPPPPSLWDGGASETH